MFDLGTVSAVELLPPRVSPYWHVIEFCRHVGVRVLAPDDRRWMARVRTRKGGYRVTTLGAAGSEGLPYDEALEQARRWFSAELTAEVASDPYPRGSRREMIYCPYGTRYTVGHALGEYVEWKRISAAESHFLTNLNLINHHILPRLGFVPLDELTGRHLNRFALDVLETPPRRGNRPAGPRRALADLSPEDLRKRKGTLNTLVGILRLAIRLAWENGETNSERAWRCIRRVPNTQRPRTVFLRRDECRSLLAACREDLRRLVLGALYTGCRATELERMTVSDVAAQVFGLYVAPQKTRRGRYVFLPDEGMHYFLDVCAGRGPDDRVFLHQDGTTWRGRYKHLFRNAVAAAGLPPEFVFHGLRHTYASQLVQAGTPLLVVAEQLGHATPDTVGRTYGHLAPQFREAQIRTNFAVLDAERALNAHADRRRLDAMSATLQGEDWRRYGALPEENAWPRSNFAQGDGIEFRHYSS